MTSIKQSKDKFCLSNFRLSSNNKITESYEIVVTLCAGFIAMFFLAVYLPYVVPPAPKLMPRPTAASTARAALNATNRGLSANNTSPVVRTTTNRVLSPNLKRRSSVSHREPLGKIDPQMETETDPKNSHDTFTKNSMDNEVTNEKDILEDRKHQQEPSNKTTVIQEQLYQGVVILSDNENCDYEQESIALVSASSGNRPHTPKNTNTPKTGKSTEATRPNTPNGTQDNTSRPTTPQRQKKGQPKTIADTLLPPSSGLQIEATPLPEEVTPNLTNDNAEMLLENDIKAAYTAKQKQFQQMKKELDLKQQSVLEVFDGLRSLGERMSQEGETGGGEGAMQELLLFHVADWPAEELTQLYRDVTIDPEGATQLIDSVNINECTLNDLESKIQSIPDQFGELCLQAFSARQELVDWVKELVHTDNPEENGEGEAAQRITLYNTQGLQLCDALHQLKERADGAVHTISCVSKRVWRDQNALIAVGKSLVRDIARLKQDLETQANVINEMRQRRAEAEPNALEETRQQLDEERAAKQALTEKLAHSETLLRQTKARIAKMDRQLHEAEASITNLTGTVKALEDQSRQREAHVEARARKLRESLKTGEVASGHLAQQRDALQAEVTELKDQIEKLTNQHKHSLKELKNQLKQTSSALEELKQASQKRELELITERDTALAERHATVEALEAKIMELERNVSDENGEQNYRATREMELIAELQATKVELHMAEDEIAVCKREKVRFLETLTNISDSENKLGMQQKLAAELLNKEEVIGKLRIQIRELCKNDKLLDQKVIQYEHYINFRVQNTGSNSDNLNDINQQDLQKEILNLRVKLLEAVHRNEELLESLAEKEQQLDQQDKTSRAQARVIKVREELINMLKSKETEQSRELSALQQDLENRMTIVDDVNKQIAAKAAEIQELFATLESKQQQIHRLEKIVLALEEQQRRAQAQRTRYEEKIASLEHELANGYRRERKFLFF